MRITVAALNRRRGLNVAALRSTASPHSSLFVNPALPTGSNTSSNTSSSMFTSPVLLSRRSHGDDGGDRMKPMTIFFTLPDGETVKEVTAYEGQNLLDVAAENKLPMEGACAGSCACSTCHVYIPDVAALGTFPEPTEEEDDMIDTAFYPQPDSRLGCQLTLYKSKHNGLKVKMPRATRNMYVDGAVPVPH